MKFARLLDDVIKFSRRWFSMPLWQRNAVIIVLSALLGWLIFGLVGFWLHEYLIKYQSDRFIIGVFSTVGFIEHLVLFYVASMVMFKQLELNDHSFRDPLTGLYNRRYLRAERRRLSALACKNKLYVAVYFIDLDDFGLINKAFNHRIGDAALKLAARAISLVFKRMKDVVVRYGGDEFVVVCLFDRIEDFEKMGDELRLKLSKLRYVLVDTDEQNCERQVPVDFSASVGQAIGKDYSDQQIKKLISDADADMQNRKRDSKNDAKHVDLWIVG